MRWLVVRGGALGDFLLTLPALEVVRRQAARVTLVANPRYARLRPDLYDELVDLRGTEALWLFGAGPPPLPLPDAALVYTPGVAGTLRGLGVGELRGAPPRPPPGRHAVDHLLEPVLDLGPAPEPRLHAGPFPSELPGPCPVVLAPGAASPDKVWPGFGEVAERLRGAGCPVVWAPGKDEPAPPMRGTVYEGLDLPALAALAAGAGAWLGNDTGTTHLAAAAGAPVLALFGPTDPACWAPRRARVIPFGTTPDDIVQTLMITREQTLLSRSVHTPPSTR